MTDTIDIKALISIATEAGDAILAIYRQDFAVYEKNDASPLTEADLASHRVIVDALKQLTPEIPVLSEEDADIPFEERSSWSAYWLIDPLDGTKEFIKKNDEFTVNIALIRNGKAVVLTAEEVSAMGRESTAAEIARKVDVVTTATFGPMCSSGMFINTGHSDPPIQEPDPGFTSFQPTSNQTHSPDSFPTTEY